MTHCQVFPTLRGRTNLLVEWNFGVRNTTPRSIPSVENHHENIAVVCEQLSKVSLDKVDLLLRDIEVTDVISFTMQ